MISKYFVWNNQAQAVKYETGAIKFKNFDKQIPSPFKIYADSEGMLKRVNINKDGYTKLYQKHVPNSIGAKLVGIDLLYQLKFLLLVTVLKNLLNGFLNNKKTVMR